MHSGYRDAEKCLLLVSTDLWIGTGSASILGRIPRKLQSPYISLVVRENPRNQNRTDNSWVWIWAALCWKMLSLLTLLQHLGQIDLWAHFLDTYDEIALLHSLLPSLLVAYPGTGMRVKHYNKSSFKGKYLRWDTPQPKMAVKTAQAICLRWETKKIKIGLSPLDTRHETACILERLYP